MTIRIEHEPGRFFARVGEVEAFLVYERRGAVLDVRHTFTPPALRGRDIAAQLTAAVVAYAQAEGLKILPTCTYTRAYIERHPELEGLSLPPPARPGPAGTRGGP
jgi:predicted GNAT family acetyltransferase